MILFDSLLLLMRVGNDSGRAKIWPVTRAASKRTSLRDPATQRLTFVYRFEDPSDSPGLGLERAELTLSSFAGVLTDVSADASAGGPWVINRSADGAIVAADNAGNGLGQLPYFVTATDATAFDRNGTLSGGARDEFTSSIRSRCPKARPLASNSR